MRLRVLDLLRISIILHKQINTYCYPHILYNNLSISFKKIPGTEVETEIKDINKL